MVIKNEADQSPQSSHLFMLRLWLEDLGGGQINWRGKVQHVNSGEVRYFRDWLTMEIFVEELIYKINPEGSIRNGVEETDLEARSD